MGRHDLGCHQDVYHDHQQRYSTSPTPSTNVFSSQLHSPGWWHRNDTAAATSAQATARAAWLHQNSLHSQLALQRRKSQDMVLVCVVCRVYLIQDYEASHLRLAHLSGEKSVCTSLFFDSRICRNHLHHHTKCGNHRGKWPRNAPLPLLQTLGMLGWTMPRVCSDHLRSLSELDFQLSKRPMWGSVHVRTMSSHTFPSQNARLWWSHQKSRSPRADLQ